MVLWVRQFRTFPNRTLPFGKFEYGRPAAALCWALCLQKVLFGNFFIHIYLCVSHSAREKPVWVVLWHCTIPAKTNVRFSEYCADWGSCLITYRYIHVFILFWLRSCRTNTWKLKETLFVYASFSPSEDNSSKNLQIQANLRLLYLSEYLWFLAVLCFRQITADRCWQKHYIFI